MGDCVVKVFGLQGDTAGEKRALGRVEGFVRPANSRAENEILQQALRYFRLFGPRGGGDEE